MHGTINRRGFVKSLAGISVAGLIGSPAFAQDRHIERSTGPAGKLPARGKFIVRGAYVLTMDDGEPTPGPLEGGR